ncbi:MAG: GNAT family N-acetyltransferase [Candidatus Wallbacteria bacterium HGW-Wallbacteria-1]|jgi:RimJ/RimL family protein N-acetyltransferase|uniref:GNAT family N-acetyltransferase n=1 Tax=Candidatus Wallbacteria bacterium HGW-Wallbacteria-1 TaxID=2013854 RepID=A0A2N1PLL0_9BACT|nr:MAG: GNAT family N-acetyltransferase [Candidatus Wallbacteria bacterium HGW-Wallbacteria-1]
MTVSIWLCNLTHWFCQQKKGLITLKNISICTPRLEIRYISLNDSQLLLEYRGDESVQKFESFRPETIEEVNGFITENSGDFNVEGTWCQLGVYLNNRLIGDIGIHFIGPDNEQCEIGYAINPSSQRQGYGRESVRHVMDYLFRVLKKHRIAASLHPENIASIHLLESIGLRREGLFRKSFKNNGVWEDDLIYAILREEWNF